MSDYRWEVTDPLGNVVVLKSTTYYQHIMDDNDKSETEIENLTYVEEYVKNIIQNPRYIYKDVDYENNQRHRYIDLVGIPDFNHLQALVVVVDTDRTPHEVVTWTIKRNLKQERILEEGGIIYDSKKFR